MTGKILDLPIGARPDPDEFVRAAMEWHFNPETGSVFCGGSRLLCEHSEITCGCGVAL